MDVRKFNEDEALLISETTEGAYEAVRNYVTVFFAHYITNHIPEGENSDYATVAVTMFYNELMEVLRNMEVPEAAYIMRKANEYVDAKEKAKKEGEEDSGK